MDINELYCAIQEVNSNPSLDEERRTTRLTIYQALLYYINDKNKLNRMINEILDDGHKLEKLSDYTFFLNEDFEKTRILVKGFILESKFIKELKSKGVTKFSFEDVEKYLKQYISASGDTIDDVSVAVTMYPKLLTYKTSYIEVYDKVAKYLSEIFGEEMLKNSGDVRLKYERILERVERMVGRALFDEKTREWLERLINELFSYYVNNKIVIPIETQIDVSGTKELIA